MKEQTPLTVKPNVRPVGCSSTVVEPSKARGGPLFIMDEGPIPLTSNWDDKQLEELKKAFERIKSRRRFF